MNAISNLISTFAHAGHHHPERTTGTWNGDGILIGAVLGGVALIVLAVVVFDIMRKKSRKD